MRYRTLLATGVVAMAGMGVAGGALAAPKVTNVDAVKTGAHRLSVGVTTVRGRSHAKPRITVKVGRRLGRAKASDWQRALTDRSVQSYARLGDVTAAVGSTVTIRVRSCDTTCAVSTHEVKVDAEVDDTDPAAPLPVGSVDAAGAVSAALAFVGPGSTLIEVERADEHGAAWQVEVRRADGAKVEVFVNADGSIAAAEVDGDAESSTPDGDHGDQAPLPAGAITADQAAVIALNAVGDGSALIKVERTDDDGAAWEVAVRRADGVNFKVKIAADGSVVKAEPHD